MEKRIRQALDAAGYLDQPATREALIQCFLDYVDAGIWENLFLEDAIAEIEDGEITTEAMIRGLLSC